MGKTSLAENYITLTKILISIETTTTLSLFIRSLNDTAEQTASGPVIQNDQKRTLYEFQRFSVKRKRIQIDFFFW